MDKTYFKDMRFLAAAGRAASFFAAIVLGKAAYAAIRLFGKSGTSFAGVVALKICPDFLRICGGFVRKKNIAVTGTNGKTTTSALAAAVLDGRVIHNTGGANMTQGIANAFVLGLPRRFDYSVMEVDEAYLTKVYDGAAADYLIVTNLFPDQVDRLGGVDAVAGLIKDAIAKKPDLKLILNADNEASASLGEGVTFGFDNLADYKAKVEVVEDKSEITLGTDKFVVPLQGRYNAYNALAAVVLGLETGVPVPKIQTALANYKTVACRGEKRLIKGHPAVIQLIKNAAGTNEVLKTVDLTSQIVIAINNNVSDGRDVSWLGDVEFERLKDSAVIATGMCAQEVTVQLKKSGVKNVTTEPSVKKAIEIAAGSRENGKITILPSYTAMKEIK